MKKMWGLNSDDGPSEADKARIKKELGISRDLAIKAGRWFDDKRVEALEEVLGEMAKNKGDGLATATAAADRYMGVGIKMHSFLSKELPELAEEFRKANPKMTPGMMDAMCKLVTAHVIKAVVEGADELKAL